MVFLCFSLFSKTRNGGNLYYVLYFFIFHCLEYCSSKSLFEEQTNDHFWGKNRFLCLKLETVFGNRYQAHLDGNFLPAE